MSVAEAPAASSQTVWNRWPQTEEFVDRWIDQGLEGNAFATALAGRMIREIGSRFKVWVDHLVVSGSEKLGGTLIALGYERQPGSYAVGVPVYAHPGGIFPRIALVSSRSAADKEGMAAIEKLAIKVESIAAFSRAHDLGLEIQGYPQGPYRTARVSGDRTDLLVVERRGYLGFEPFPGELARGGGCAPTRPAMHWPRTISGWPAAAGSTMTPLASTRPRRRYIASSSRRVRVTWHAT